MSILLHSVLRYIWMYRFVVTNEKMRPKMFGRETSFITRNGRGLLLFVCRRVILGCSFFHHIFFFFFFLFVCWSETNGVRFKFYNRTIIILHLLLHPVDGIGETFGYDGMIGRYNLHMIMINLSAIFR